MGGQMLEVASMSLGKVVPSKFEHGVYNDN
jgi:hypothetical protein